MDEGLSVERQAVYAGDEVSGLLSGSLNGASPRISLRGEEIVAANSIVGSFVHTVLDETQETEGAFKFRIPPDAPPSYASRDLRCEYFLRADGRRLHLTVLPAPRERVLEPIDRIIYSQGARILFHLDGTTLAAGDALRGLMDISAEPGEGPDLITVAVSAIEESNETDLHHHKKMLWAVSRNLAPGIAFEIVVPKDAPFSGDWRSFRVYYTLSLELELLGGRHTASHVFPMEVYRNY